MMKSFAVVVAISLMMLSLLACQSQQGVTLSVSMTGQPNGGETNVGANVTVLPSVYYRGISTNLTLSYNVLSAPAGGIVTILPRFQVVTVTGGTGALPIASVLNFSIPGTYVVQVVVAEDGTGDLSAADQSSFIVLPAVSN
jgi:hypothetical protein